MESHFSKEDIQMANRHEKVLKITHDQGNANQNHKEITLYQSEWLLPKSKQTSWRRCGEKGTFVHCWSGCKLVRPLWETIFLKKL